MKTELSPFHTTPYAHTLTLDSPSRAAQLHKFPRLCAAGLLTERPSCGAGVRPQLHSNSQFVSAMLFLSLAISEHIAALCLFFIVSPSHLFFSIFSVVPPDALIKRWAN